MFVSTVDELSKSAGDTTDSGWSLEGGKLAALDGESCFVTVPIPQGIRPLHPFSLDLMSIFDDRFNRSGRVAQACPQSFRTHAEESAPFIAVLSR